jgi:UDP-glucose 4-epimerase
MYIGDLLNVNRLEDIFKKERIDFVIHFAGLKSVKESIEKPLLYYDNNVKATLNLLNTMEKYNIKKLIFSSSATVYGNSGKCPIKESDKTGSNIVSVYGKTKFLIEEILKDLKGWSIVILRYFNPIGCHPSGILGEDPNDTPNNLFPYILKVASGELNELQIYGKDYPTKDGTCIRDFIHVEDLASAHILSMKKLSDKKVHIYNVGTGIGYSVLDIIHTFEKVNDIILNKKFVERRDGDIAILYSDPTKIKNDLEWTPKKNIVDMCKDGYNYIIKKDDEIEEDFILDETFVSDLTESILETIEEESRDYNSSSE